MSSVTAPVFPQVGSGAPAGVNRAAKSMLELLVYVVPRTTTLPSGSSVNPYAASPPE